jgi:hypothetical protein
MNRGDEAILEIATRLSGASNDKSLFTLGNRFAFSQISAA